MDATHMVVLCPATVYGIKGTLTNWVNDNPHYWDDHRGFNLSVSTSWRSISRERLKIINFAVRDNVFVETQGPEINVDIYV